MGLPTVRQLFIDKFSKLTGDKADPQEMMNTISWHETGPDQRLSPKAVQRLADGSEGEGKGKYQFEKPALKDAARLLKMAYRDAGSKDKETGEWKYPDWIHDVVNEDGNLLIDDARELTEEHQDELFLANIMMKKGSDSDIMNSLESGDYTNLWLVHHWGGSAGSKGFTDKQIGQIQEREKSFKDSSGAYNQFKEYMSERQRQMNQITNDNLFVADEEVVEEQELEHEPKENEAVTSVFDIEKQGVIGDYKEMGKPNEYK